MLVTSVMLGDPSRCPLLRLVTGPSAGPIFPPRKGILGLRQGFTQPAHLVNWNRAVRLLPSPRSRFMVLQDLAYVVGVFQLSW